MVNQILFLAIQFHRQYLWQIKPILFYQFENLYSDRIAKKVKTLNQYSNLNFQKSHLFHPDFLKLCSIPEYQFDH